MKKRASVYRLQWNDDIFYYTKTTGAMFLMSGFASLCTDRKTNQSLENTRKARCTLVQRAFCVMALVDCFDRMVYQNFLSKNTLLSSKTVKKQSIFTRE